MDRDIKIVKKVLNGEPQYFEELVSKYQGSIIRTCYKFVKNEQDAKDIAQEVFIKIYNNLSCYKEYSKFSTWIYRITVNTCLNHLRKKDLLNISFCDDFKTESENELRQGMFNAGGHQNPEEAVVAKEVKMLLETELESLGERGKHISGYRIKYGMPFKKIADKVGGTEASARMSFSRVRKKLTEKLMQYNKGE